MSEGYGEKAQREIAEQDALAEKVKAQLRIASDLFRGNLNLIGKAEHGSTITINKEDLDFTPEGMVATGETSDKNIKTVEVRAGGRILAEVPCTYKSRGAINTVSVPIDISVVVRDATVKVKTQQGPGIVR